MIRAALLLAALAGPAAAAETWREVRWPWPRDAWPAGRAFECEGCDGPLEVYVRAKLGFCNCSTGVTDDAEVDGVADLDMLSAAFEPHGPGAALFVSGLAGRMRGYAVTLPGGAVRGASGFALSNRCDLVVAASVGPGADAAPAQEAVTRLLGSGAVGGWVRSLVGL